MYFKLYNVNIHAIKGHKTTNHVKSPFMKLSTFTTRMKLFAFPDFNRDHSSPTWKIFFYLILKVPFIINPKLYNFLLNYGLFKSLRTFGF